MKAPLASLAALAVVAGTLGLVLPQASAASTYSTPGYYQCTVQGSGTQTLNYTVSGAPGGGNPPPAGGGLPGALGAFISGTMQVNSGTTLYLTVGSPGLDAPANVANPPGGGGGGYSSISTALTSGPIVVAGGGGGSAAAFGGASLANRNFSAGFGGQGAVSGNSLSGGEGGTTNSPGNGGTIAGSRAPSGGVGGSSGYSGGPGGPTTSGAGGGGGFGSVGGVGDVSRQPSIVAGGWTNLPTPFGAGGGGGLAGGGGGGGWAGGGGGGGANASNEIWTIDGGGGGAGSSMLISNSAFTGTTSSAGINSSAASVQLSGVTCDYMVTYFANGGTGTVPVDPNGYTPGSSATAADGSGLTGPAGSPNFVGWTPGPGDPIVWTPGSAIVMNEPQQLWAVYSDEYAAFFNANGGGGLMDPQLATGPTELLPNAFTPPLANQVFTGWNTAPDGSGTAYADGATYAFNANITLYAQWTNATTVTFDSNGGTGSMASQTAYQPTPLYANAFSNAGYRFANWNTSADGSGTAYANQAVYSFSASTTLYAQWQSTAPTTVTFNANGGSGTMPSQTDDTPTALEPNGFTAPPSQVFAGWNTAADGSGTAYANGGVYPFNADVTLYAQWGYTVTFKGNGGSGAMAPQKADSPTPLTMNSFTRLRYQFNGWNTAPDGSGKAYANGGYFLFTSNATLYAQWGPFTDYRVTFNANGGSGTMAPQLGHTPEPLKPNTLDRDNYTFIGWNTAPDGSGTAYANGAVYPFNAGTTLYAQWTPEVFIVSFDANGGTGSMTPQASTVPAALSSNGFAYRDHAFAGWNTAPDGSGTAYAPGAVFPFNANVTLYAQWTQIPGPVRTLEARQSGTNKVAVSWSQLPTTGLTYTARLLKGRSYAGIQCATRSSACTLVGMRPGSYMVELRPTTANGVLGRVATVNVIVRAITLDVPAHWRGTGSTARRVYAVVTVSTSALADSVQVWHQVKGSRTWAKRPANTDSWYCQLTSGGPARCEWSRPLRKAAKVKFEVDGIFSKVVKYPGVY